MEDYEYKVIKLHATLFQNSSKFTGDISNNTSKSTSKTDQIKVLRAGPRRERVLPLGGWPKAECPHGGLMSSWRTQSLSPLS